MARVGLLEDNSRIARFCAVMLHLAGFGVTIYTTPQMCFDALWATSSPDDPLLSLPIDVLILDLHLPEMDGIDVVRSLLDHPQTKSLPLVVCTAADLRELRQMRALVPDVPIVQKPFTLLSLQNAIAQVLQPV